MSVHYRKCNVPDCNGTIGIEDADFDTKEAVENNGVFDDDLQCNVCGAKYRAVIWYEVVDENDELTEYAPWEDMDEHYRMKTE